MALPTVFISYNPYAEVEQTLAIRLHTIGAVHGLNMLLPDRSFGSSVVSPETKSRIMLSDFFILFSTSIMSNVVRDEIDIAFKKLADRSKILVVYDRKKGKNLSAAINCTEVYIDTQDDPLKIVTQITAAIKNVQSKPQQNSFLSSLGGILMIGVGLFALNELLSDDDPPPRRKPIKKIARKKKSR